MMYNTKVRPEMKSRLTELRTEFQKIYDEFGVKIVGNWVCATDDTETFYMTQFDNEEDYDRKIAALHEDERYLKLSAQLNEIRLEFRATRLFSN